MNIELILQIAGLLVTIVAAGLVCRQIKIAAHEAQFQTMKNIDVVMKRVDNKLYSIPKHIVYCDNEFPENPPLSHVVWKKAEHDRITIENAKAKRAEFLTPGGGYEKYDKKAAKAISALNEIAQYIENRYIDYATVLGQYHLKIIRIIHIVEPFRNKLEKTDDYGDRLLRLRKMAVHYHKMHKKHSVKDVELRLSNKEIIHLIKGTSGMTTEQAKKERRIHRKAFNKYSRIYRRKKRNWPWNS